MNNQGKFDAEAVQICEAPSHGERVRPEMDVPPSGGPPESRGSAKPPSPARFKWGRPDQPLNAKQAAFVEEYLRDGNAARAAVAAGYSARRRRETGCELLRDPRIAAAIAARRDELDANIRAAQANAVAVHATVQAERMQIANDTADQIAQELRQLAEKAQSLTDTAEEGGDTRAALLGLREMARLLELKARLVGRLGASFEINLNTINVAMLSDAELQAFLEKVRPRVSDIFNRQVAQVIDDDAVGRQIELLLSRRVGRHVTLDEAVAALRAMEPEDEEDETISDL
jgi:hypothetical protein